MSTCIRCTLFKLFFADAPTEWGNISIPNGDPHSEFVLCIYPSKVHTCSSEPGEQFGVRCLAQGHLSRGIEGGESVVHSPRPRQFLPDRDSNSQPFDYESDSITIRPQLPQEIHIVEHFETLNTVNLAKASVPRKLCVLSQSIWVPLRNIAFLQ